MLKLSFSSFSALHSIALFLLFSFLDLLSVSKPVLWTPGTAQIGEGVENSWGDPDDSEKEDDDEGGSDEAVIFDSIKMDTEIEVSNTGSQGRWYFMTFNIYINQLYVYMIPIYRLKYP